MTDFGIHFDKPALKRRIKDLISEELTDTEIRDKYGLEDTHGWKLSTCRQKLREESNWEDAFCCVPHSTIRLEAYLLFAACH